MDKQKIIELAYRGKPIDGSVEFVYGWYCYIQEYEFSTPKHLIIRKNARIVNPCGGLVINAYPNYYIDRWVEVIPETVSQQVDQQDINNKEIYQGDKVKTKCGGIFTVIFENGAFRLQEPVTELWYCELNSYKVTELGLEIIGTIHDQEKQ